MALLGFALCVMTPIVLSEAGTTFIDFVTALPVLGAYALLITRHGVLGPVRSAILAGVLLGLATALKLTNGVFAFGVTGFVLAGRDSFRHRIRWLVTCGLSAVAGFLLVGGAWQLGLWERFGNPVFPSLQQHIPFAWFW